MIKKILFIFFILMGWQAAQAQVAVIAHKAVPVDQISSAELLDFYTGDIKLWGNDEAVIVFDLKPKGEVKEVFYKYLGKSPSRMKSVWMKKLLSGEGDPPESMKTEKELLEKVMETPGSIGFVAEDKVTDDVKVLAVITREEG